MQKRRFDFAGKKGFLGPIGDDLPSMIPIVMSLALFFMVFGATFSTYNTKNATIRQQFELTSVARELKGDSLLLSVDQFEQRCNDVKLNTYPYSFMAGVYRADADLDSIFSDFEKAGNGEMAEDRILSDIDSPDSEGKYYFCKFKRSGAAEFSLKQKKYTVRFYPIAVQVYQGGSGTTGGTYLITPGLMAMVVWG
ncbi:MAG: hypothetical protein AABW59_03915 [archaeon]